MAKMRSRLFLVLFLGAAPLALGASFQNLDFDEADLSKALPGPPIFGRREDFLPGWQLFSGSNPVPFVGLNLAPTGPDYATLIDTNADLGPSRPVEGRFSLELVPGFGPGQRSIPYSLRQRGEIAEGIRTIHFLSYEDHMRLTLDGIDVPLAYVPRSFEPIEINDVYGDVSAFAGRTVDLSLTTLITDRPAGFGLDSISFSIPEPSSLLLLGLGLFGLWLGLKWPRSRPRGTQAG